MSPPRLVVCVVDSDQHAVARRRDLDVDRELARRLGEVNVRFIEQGWCPAANGRRVSWSEAARTGSLALRGRADGDLGRDT